MFISIGALLMLICAVWFIVLSIQMGQSTAEKVLWAIANFLFQPLAGIIFFFVKKSQSCSDDFRHYRRYSLRVWIYDLYVTGYESITIKLPVFYS